MRSLLPRSFAVALVVLAALIASAPAGAEEVSPSDGPWVDGPVVAVESAANPSELEILVPLTKAVDPTTLVPGQNVELLTTSEQPVPILAAELQENQTTIDIHIEGTGEYGPLHVVLMGDSGEQEAVIADPGGTPLGTNALHPLGRNYTGEVHPTVSSVAVPSAGTYGAGASLDFVVSTSEPTYVDTGGGVPSLPISLGDGSTVYATYLQGSGTEQLTFRYTVAAGNTGGISVGSALALGGGTLSDAAGYTLEPALADVEEAGGVQLDGVAPPSISPSASSSTTPAPSAPPTTPSPLSTATKTAAPPARCASQRKTVIHLLAPRGVRLRTATLFVDDRRLTSFGRGKGAVAVSFLGWPSSTVRLTIRATTTGGLHLISVRQYHLCSGAHRRSADRIALHRVHP